MTFASYTKSVGLPNATDTSKCNSSFSLQSLIDIPDDIFAADKLKISVERIQEIGLRCSTCTCFVSVSNDPLAVNLHANIESTSENAMFSNACSQI